MRRIAAVLASASLALCACSATYGEETSAVSTENVSVQKPASSSTLNSAPAPTNFAIVGELTQGGWLRGTAPGGAVQVTLDGAELALSPSGEFFAAFDRDAGQAAMLVAILANGRRVERPLAIAPRSWKIEHVNVARRSSGPTEAFMELRRPELEQINAARSVNADSDGWRQRFIWPVTGRISGRFGSQRIYRGEPGSYHSGIDITSGASGTPFVAPADGVVVLAAKTPFTLEGYLLMIDHGGGLNSAFLHCSQIAVVEGQRVTQGQYIGRIGSTGRVTGPHLHWGLKWRDARLDPLLFTGPMK
jgi:hypothetical protein